LIIGDIQHMTALGSEAPFRNVPWEITGYIKLLPIPDASMFNDALVTVSLNGDATLPYRKGYTEIRQIPRPNTLPAGCIFWLVSL